MSIEDFFFFTLNILNTIFDKILLKGTYLATLQIFENNGLHLVNKMANNRTKSFISHMYLEYKMEFYIFTKYTIVSQ